MKLAERKCVPCSGGIPALEADEVAKLKQELQDWQAVDNKKLVKAFKFDDFKKPMQLADKIAAVADEEDHHPDLIVRWGELVVELWTHKVHGLTENDFILAAKIDRCAAQ